jgi:hypothetical protein
MQSVRSSIQAYSFNGTFDVVLRNCFELRIYWISDLLPLAGPFAELSGPFIQTNFGVLVFYGKRVQPSGDIYLQQQVLIFKAPSPSLLINDQFTVKLDKMDAGDQFVIQQQIIVDRE